MKLLVTTVYKRSLGVILWGVGIVVFISLVILGMTVARNGRFDKSVYAAVTDDAFPASLQNATDLRWTRMVIIGPYTSVEQIRSLADTDVSQNDVHRIDERDDICLVLIFDNDRLLRSIEVNRITYDLCLAKWGPLPKVVMKASLPVSQNASGVALRKVRSGGTP